MLERVYFSEEKGSKRGAANNRLVLPVAVFVTVAAESVGFRSPALPVCEGLVTDGVLNKTGKYGDCSSNSLR